MDVKHALILAVVITAFVVALVILILLRHQGHAHVQVVTHNGAHVVLFPGYSTNFSIIGSYLSQSRYSMVEIYGNGVSLMTSPFLWNVRTAFGVVNMTFTPYLRVVVCMNSITKITPSIPVDGYPGLMYGQEYWFPFSGKTMTSRLLPLPMIVSQLPGFYSFVNFTVFDKVGVIQDFSYDIWLVENPNTTYLAYGDFEVMIWMYWNENIGGNKYFVYVGTMEIPTYVNGTLENLNWQVYVLPRTGGPNGWTSIYVLAPTKLQGSIGVPIAYILKDLGPYLKRAGINLYEPGKYYLNAMQVGMEFDDEGGSACLGYVLYSWYLMFPAVSVG